MSVFRRAGFFGAAGAEQDTQELAERNDVTVVMAVPVPELVEPLAHKIAIIADGQLLAFDSADGLRRQTGCAGSLLEVLEALVHPKAKTYIDSTWGDIQ
jgi:ABC-type multidrug transport system ATPase subunit